MLVAGTGTAAAAAAAGDATATGIDVDATITVPGGPTARIDRTIGQVTAPPDDSASVVNGEINADLPLPFGMRTLARVATLDTTATSGPSGSAATARLTGIQVNTPAGPLGINAAGAEVSCPTDGTPTASVDSPVTVTFAGRTVTIDATGEATFTFPPPWIEGTVTVVIDARTTTTTTAAATALQAQVELSIPGVISGTGEMTVAQTSCEQPGAQVAPTASWLKPRSGPTTGGTTVTVNGTGFVPGQTSVTIGDATVPADKVTVAPDGESLTFVTPAHPAGRVGVVVTTPGGSTEPLRFRYKDSAPEASWLTPKWGPTTGGTTVTVNGTGFVPGQTSVTIGDATVPADKVTVAPDGESLTFVTPAHPAGRVGVVVTTPGGSTEPLRFRYKDSAPEG